MSLKIQKLIATLPPKAHKKIKCFLESPFFNKKSNLLQLFQWFVEPLNRPFDAKLGFALIYPQRQFDPTQWHLLTSQLFKLLEKYLVIEALDREPMERQGLLSQEYRYLQQEKLFRSAHRDWQKLTEKHSWRDARYLYHRYQIEYEYYDYIASPKRRERTNLQAVSDGLDHYFLAEKFKQACLALSRHLVNQEEYHVGMLEEALHYVKAHPAVLEVPAVAIYYYVFQAISPQSDESDFHNLRQAMERYQSRFSPLEMRDIYFYAINYCIRRLNTGSPSFVREAFELYRLSLEKGFLLEDRVMPESTFGNIVSLATKLEEYDWAEQFIENHRDQLKTVFRQPLYLYNLAQLRYAQAQFDDCLYYLAQMDTKAPFLLLGAKTLQLKIYYEQKEIQALESLLDSLRVYLQRHKNFGYRRENYENLIAFTRRLLGLAVMSTEEKIRLRQEIESAKVFTEKQWILQWLD